MNKMSLSVVIPAYNEEGSLGRTIDAIDRALTDSAIPHEILVVDDHSTDGTAEVLERLTSKYPSLRSVPNLRPNGFGNAVHTGLDEFRGDAVCIVMADASDDPEDIVAYYRKLTEGYDCVFGSRFMKGGKVVKYPLHKLLLNRVANLFVQILFGLGYDDVTNAFKCYRRSVVEGIRPILSHHFNITVELPLKAIARGYSYAVTPIRWYCRLSGISKLRVREMGSRYLFIVLYVWLEQHLSRGDYRQVSQSGEASAGAKPGWRGYSTALTWLTLLCIAAVHALFIKTYPLNDLGGDTPAYYHLLTNRLSNLALAPGYPFLAGLPLSIHWIAALAARHPFAFRNTLLFAQHGFDLCCLAVLLRALERIYNRRTAIIAVLICGLSLQGMGVTSSVYPEWLQADLLILALSFAVFGWQSEALPAKSFWYAMSFGAFTWSYLVKFNVAVFFPVLLTVISFEKVRWQQRVRLVLIAATFALFNYGLFVGLYHRPKTGTFAISYDHAWILTNRLSQAYHGRLPYPQGIETKRWLALSAVLPPSYEVASASPFENVDSVPINVRAPYRRTAGHLLTADEATLDAVLRDRHLPATFNLALSSIPTSWYIGLRESDELGVKVFFESVLHRPNDFIASVTKKCIDAMREPASGGFPWRRAAQRNGLGQMYPLFPTQDIPRAFGVQAIVKDDNHLRLVAAGARAIPHLPYFYSDPVIWRPGYSLFSEAVRIRVPHKLIVAFIMIGFLSALFVAVIDGWSFRTATPLILTAMLAVFVIFSNVVLLIRWKEVRLVLPVVASLIGIATGWTLPELIHGVRRKLMRARVAKARRRSLLR